MNIKIIIVLVVIGIGIYMFGFKGVERKNVDMLLSENMNDVIGEDISYFENARGYFVHPQSPGNYPGVVMIHEWWGLNDTIKQMARQLASEGYNVLAVDLHKGRVATTPEEARALTGAINQEQANANLRSAVAYLRNKGSVKIASLGWCFGGGQSLQLAMSGEELAATVIYYGQLSLDQTKLSLIRWPVLGIFGDKDTSISVENVRSFEAALTTLGIQNSIHIYSGVGHAFANPSGANYAPQETIDAWSKTLAFLSANLKQN